MADERWTHPKTGKSTDYAEKFGKERLEDLKKELGNKIPNLDDLDVSPKKVVAGDTLLALLKKHLPRGTFKDGDMMMFAYRHMLEESKKKEGDINYLEVGDTVTVSNGVVIVTRGKKARSKGFKNINVPLFPYPNDPGGYPSIDPNFGPITR